MEDLHRIRVFYGQTESDAHALVEAAWVAKACSPSDGSTSPTMLSVGFWTLKYGPDRHVSI